MRNRDRSRILWASFIGATACILFQANHLVFSYGLNEGAGELIYFVFFSVAVFMLSLSLARWLIEIANMWSHEYVWQDQDDGRRTAVSTPLGKARWHNFKGTLTDGMSGRVFLQFLVAFLVVLSLRSFVIDYYTGIFKVTLLLFVVGISIYHFTKRP